MNPVKERRIRQSLDERTREAGQMSANVAATLAQAAQARRVYVPGDAVIVTREREGVRPATVVSMLRTSQWSVVTVEFDDGSRLAVEVSRVERRVKR